ncbi:FMN-binding negative transcriptional regulator [Macrococcus animalis]|uniref:FMN-binding negative transcriptional regulator n=1 Tax=Macrococcus animalis TaxID=3395467 RepID=UPI0039BE2EEB
MFNPKPFKVENYSEQIEFIKAHPFATLISTIDGVPYASQIPITINEFDDFLILSGYLAKANPQLKTLDGNANVLILFTGPHAYISSSWYKDEEVSTWNYQSAQIRGESELMSENELMIELEQLTNRYELGRENARTFNTLSENVLKQANGVTGFKIRVNEIQVKYKMSQNRSEEDYQNIVHHLEREGETESAEAMNRIRKGK